MAVFSSTGTITPVIGVETDVVTIAPGNPLDNLTVYFQGGQFGAGGPIGLALYAVVGGFRTRVAQADQQGSAQGVIVEFQSIGRGDSETEEVDAGGTSYIITAIDKSTVVPSPAIPVRQPITVTLAGVDTFDTVADANFGQTFGPLAPGAVGTLPILGGYAQLMDVAIDQTNLPGVFVSVAADCGPGSVQAVVQGTTMSGQDQTIAGVFRGLKLPVATRYFVSVTNQSAQNVTATLTAVTYSVSVTAGGVVALNGDVIGPSNANTVIKWSNVPLNRAGANSFAAPTDAAIPIFNAGLGTWFAITPTGDVQLTDAGGTKVVAWENVPLDPVTMGAPAAGDIPVFTAGEWVATPPGSIPFVVTLTGNANGPSNANTVQYFPTSTTNAPINVGAQPNPHGLIYEGFNGLTGPQTGTLNAAPTKGDLVIWKDEDGSLGSQTFTINGNGKLIDGLATFVMSAANVGAFGSITVLYNGTAWAIV